MIEENEFKKLASNSRDWEIYQLLSDRSQEVVKKELTSEHVSGVNIEEQKETTVQETIQGIVRIVSEKAVQIVVGINAAWIPKKCVKNLDAIVLEQGKPVELELHSWFAPKVEWKVI